MGLQEQNYWLTTTEFPTTDSSRPVPETVDVAVIGAGFTGLSAALHLADRVLVLSPRPARIQHVFEVTLPLSLPGVLAGSLLVFSLAISSRP